MEEILQTFGDGVFSTLGLIFTGFWKSRSRNDQTSKFYCCFFFPFLLNSSYIKLARTEGTWRGLNRISERHRRYKWCISREPHKDLLAWWRRNVLAWPVKTLEKYLNLILLACQSQPFKQKRNNSSHVHLFGKNIYSPMCVRSEG